MPNRRHRTPPAGFTLMEVLIVLAVIALIMGVLVGPNLINASKEAKRRIARQQAVQLAAAYERWQLDTRATCPPSLATLMSYVKKATIEDPWGSEYIMLCGPGTPPAADGFGVLSPGPDRTRGTADDITSW